MKSHLRKEMRERLLAMPAEAVTEKSRAACSGLIAQEEFRNADVVMIYLTIPGEVDTGELALVTWQHEKTVLVPKVDREQRHMIAVEIRSLETGFVAGSYGIREPVEGEPYPPEDIDLIVVPALAYDRLGSRLGRGGGFYDRFLAHPGVRAVKCGLGFEDQIVDELPTRAHDYPLDMLVTDKQVLRFGSKKSPEGQKRTHGEVEETKR
jgi:5-formyltetrahydrofolate cyclo-ligase